MILLLISYLGLTLVMLLSIAGPLLVGRWLADREPDPDPELDAIEAHALVLLAGIPSPHERARERGGQAGSSGE